MFNSTTMDVPSPTTSPTSARPDSQNNAPSYPRRRAPIACDVCRVRKTRCNAQKPSCSFCQDLNIECIYSRPQRMDRPSSRRDGQLPRPSSSMDGVLDRLGKIESVLDSLSKRGPSTPSVDPPRFSSTLNPLSCDGYWPPVHATPPDQSVHGFKLPSLLVFKTISPLYRRWAYDHLQHFYADQLESISNMVLNLRMLTAPPNLSRPNVLRLQQAFFTAVLRLFPVIDRETCLKLTELAANSGYEAVDSSVCFALLTYAIGACAQDASYLYHVDSAQLPGFAYFARAMAILDTLSSPVTDFSVLQCRILATFYHLINMRPLLAHRQISRASQDCILIIRAGLNQSSTEYGENFKRIFWTCWLYANELELCLELPPCGIRLYETTVPLPSSRYDEDGMYNLLAMISLRRVTADLNELMGYAASPSAAYGSLIAKELLQQLEEWYIHLPAPLKFPLDESPLFDLRKAYLRFLYYVHKAILLWPSLALRLGLKHLTDGDGDLVDDAQTAKVAANECLTAARTSLKVGEEILAEKSVLLHLTLRGYYPMAMAMLLAYPSNQVLDHEAEGDRLLIQHAHRALSQWKVIPFVGPALAKLEEIMEAKQIHESSSSHFYTA